MTRLIINADDYGLSDGICRSIHELYEAGAISSTTVMIAADRAIDRAETWGLRSLTGAVGTHLQLSQGRPVAYWPSVPSLVERNGDAFPPFDPDYPFEPSEVGVEWRAQIERVISCVGGCTHFDSHHGFHRQQRYFEVVESIAEEFGLPMRGGGAELESFARERGLKVPDVTVRDWTGRGLDLNELTQRLAIAFEVCPPDGVVELVTHPGYCDAYLTEVSSLNTARENDHRVLMKLAEIGWLHSVGATLVPYTPSLASM